jgi:outer membrane protein assembly factor BamB
MARISSILWSGETKMRSGLAIVVMGALLAGCAEREVILPGERFDVTVPLEDSIPREGEPAPKPPVEMNRSERINLAAPVSLSEWTHRGSNTRHLAPHSAISAQPQRIWSANIGEGNSRRYRIATTPVASGGRIFTLDARAGLVATSPSGVTLWQSSLIPPTDRGGEASGGGLAFGEGRLFVTTGFGELIAVDPATGGIIWRQRLRSPVTGAPTVADGLVYVVSRDNTAWAVGASDGLVRWEQPGSPSTAGVVGGAGPALADRLVILPFPSGELVGALRQGGVQVWNASVVGNRLGRAYGIASEITADPVVAGGVTYVGNFSGRTVALDTASGETLWQARAGAVNAVALGGGSLFLVNDQAELMRLDASTGEPIWRAALPLFTETKPRKIKGIFAHYGPVLAGGRLVVASSDGFLRFFSPTDGALVGSVALPDGAASAPIVVGGTIYVVSAAGQLHAFR